MKKMFLILIIIISFIVGCKKNDQSIYYDEFGCRSGFYIDVDGMCTKMERIAPITTKSKCQNGDKFDGKLCQPDNSKANTYYCPAGYYLINYSECAKNGTSLNYPKCPSYQTYSVTTKKCYNTISGTYISYRYPYEPTKEITCPSGSDKVGDVCLKVISEKPVK